MMAIEYKYQTGKPVVARYVKYDEQGVYSFCETGRPGRNGWVWDEAQGTRTIVDLPPDVTMKAIARRREGVWPFYVEWPL